MKRQRNRAGHLIALNRPKVRALAVDLYGRGIERIQDLLVSTLNEGGKSALPWNRLSDGLELGPGGQVPVASRTIDIQDVAGRKKQVLVRIWLRNLPQRNANLVPSGQHHDRGTTSYVDVTWNAHADLMTLRKEADLVISETADILEHELTHAKDIARRGDLARYPEHPTQARRAYFNNPIEIKALGRQIVNRAVVRFRVLRLRDATMQRYLVDNPSVGGRAVERVLSDNETYQIVAPYLTPQNDAKIRRMVAYALQQIVQE